MSTYDSYGGLSASESLPNTNFNFDELRERMARFGAKFDTFIEQGRKRVLEEGGRFHANLTELQEDQRLREKDIEIMQRKLHTEQQNIGKEEAERKEMEDSIAALSGQRDRHLARREELKEQISKTQREIDARLAAQRQHMQWREAQSRFNVPELDFWISNLGLKIEGAGKTDRLRFIFTHIDEKDWEREAWFELNMTSRDYDVKHCKPKVEREKIEKVLEKVNESRELVVLLKGMRELFVEVIKS